MMQCAGFRVENTETERQVFLATAVGLTDPTQSPPARESYRVNYLFGFIIQSPFSVRNRP